MEASTATAVREGVVFALDGLWQQFARVGDRRKRRGKCYALPLLLVLIVLAKLCGEDRPSGIADWMRHRRAGLQAALGWPLPHAPHHNTSRRVLARAMDPAELDAVLGEFLRRARRRPGRGGRCARAWPITATGAGLAAPLRERRHRRACGCTARRSAAPRRWCLSGRAPDGGQHATAAGGPAVRRVDLSPVERVRGGDDRGAECTRLAARPAHAAALRRWPTHTPAPTPA